jgi:hypothetical protein
MDKWTRQDIAKIMVALVAADLAGPSTTGRYLDCDGELEPENLKRDAQIIAVAAGELLKEWES